jgi:hypothetical protein
LGFSCVESCTSRKRMGQPTDMNHGSSTGGTLTTIVDYMDGSFLLPKGQGTVRGPSPRTPRNLKLSPLGAVNPASYRVWWVRKKDLPERPIEVQLGRRSQGCPAFRKEGGSRWQREGSPGS